ncbi:hypothetical protein KC19_6G012900 [Ceratodon purpureus]|uniref:TF-B3 domain-containing protein n=1 Tax=Ceratodon purpureus TaxID=3225 RepID=A0A8T0HBQ2_CERPU|nr:hypothetical protein KC19_6G012900 [Ceratodon purpureus]
MAHLFDDVVQEMIHLKEIPPAFTTKHRWPGTSDCCLVTSVTNMKQWFLMFVRRGSIIVSDGEGWSDFLCDRGIGVGWFLVFEVVDECCLAVTICPPRESSKKFMKILTKTHTGAYKSARLDIPARFWRDLGEDKFDNVTYTLRGPSSEATVKATCYRSPTQTFCFFATGWREYCSLNNLKKGDSLVFSLIDTTVFHVKKSSS